MTVVSTRGGTTMVATVVVVVAAAFALASLLRPLAPGEPINDKLLLHGEYVRMGVSQPVRWRPGRLAALAEARETNKPLLVVFSRSGSPAARQLDALAFSDPEMAEQVNRLFIPVRVDIDQEPAWESILMPFRRLDLSPESGFDLIVVDPDRGLAAWTVKYQVTDRLDFSGFASFLTRAKDEAEAPVPALADAHRREWSRSQMPPGTGSPKEWVTRIASDLAKGRGFLPSNTRAELESLAWSALLSGGEVDSAERGILAAAQSPMLEAVHGLFWNFSDWPDGRMVHGIAALNPNAEAAAFAARLHLVTGRREWRLLARRIVEGIRERMITPTGAATTLSDPKTAPGGKLGLSLSGPQLWAALSEPERKVAGDVFGLEASSNPRMTPYPSRLGAWLLRSHEVEEVRVKLATLQDGAQLSVGGLNLASSTSLAAARILEAGVLLDDPVILRVGEGLYSRAQLFRTGADEVLQEIESNGEALTSLTSYLAFAEASLWKHTAFGDGAALHDGYAVLKKGLSLFTQGGDLATSQRPILPIWPEDSWPLGWVDGLRPSDASLALSATTAYGVLFRDQALLNRRQRLRQLTRPLLSRPHAKMAGLARAHLVDDPKLVGSAEELRRAMQNPRGWALLRRQAEATPAPKSASTGP